MTGELAKALAAAQSEFPVINKGRTAKVDTKSGGSYSYSYADLSDILDAIRGPLSRHGLAVSQPTRVRDDGRLVVVTLLLHESGETLEGEFPFDVSGRPQETGSALTYARRYALCALLGITAEEDDDGASAQRAVPAKKRSGGVGATGNAPAPDSSLQERRHMWSVIRLKFGPDAETVLHDFCKNMGVASSKDLNAAQIAHILSEVDRLADYVVPPPPPEEKVEA